MLIQFQERTFPRLQTRGTTASWENPLSCVPLLVSSVCKHRGQPVTPCSTIKRPSPTRSPRSNHPLTSLSVCPFNQTLTHSPSVNKPQRESVEAFTHTMSRSESGNLLPLSSAGRASVVRPGSICLLGELIDGREAIRMTDADEEECRVVSGGGQSWRETIECALPRWLPKDSTSSAGPRVFQRRGVLLLGEGEEKYPF